MGTHKRQSRPDKERRISERKPIAVSESLLRAVNESGLSLYRVSKDSGVSYLALFRFIKDSRQLATDALDKLAAYLGMELVKR